MTTNDDTRISRRLLTARRKELEWHCNHHPSERWAAKLEELNWVLSMLDDDCIPDVDGVGLMRDDYPTSPRYHERQWRRY